MNGFIFKKALTFALALVAAVYVTGCGGQLMVVNQEFNKCAHALKMCGQPPFASGACAQEDIIDCANDSFVVLRCNWMNQPRPTPADIPPDAIEYTLRKFAGYQDEIPIDRVVKDVAYGLKEPGLDGVTCVTSKNGDLWKWVTLLYVKEDKHLVVRMFDNDSPFTTRDYAVDLSDVNVRLNPPPPANVSPPAGDMDTELRKLKKLRDDGILTEKEYQEQKQKVLMKY